MNITPKKGDNGTDWLAYLRTTWPIVVTIVGVATWLSVRMETPEQRTERITQFVKTMDRLDATLNRVSQQVHDHLSGPGHPVALQGIDNLSKRIDDLRTDTREILTEIKKKPP